MTRKQQTTTVRERTRNLVLRELGLRILQYLAAIMTQSCLRGRKSLLLNNAAPTPELTEKLFLSLSLCTASNPDWHFPNDPTDNTSVEISFCVKNPSFAWTCVNFVILAWVVFHSRARRTTRVHAEPLAFTQKCLRACLMHFGEDNRWSRWSC